MSAYYGWLYHNCLLNGSILYLLVFLKCKQIIFRSPYALSSGIITYTLTMGPSWVVRLSLLGLALINPAVSKDDCQPSTWRLKAVATSGGINCRMSEVTNSKVDANTCASMAKKWDITVEKFYELNPRLKDDCKNVLPNIRYCVDGCKSIAFDWLLELYANSY
jgi:hypothetical protein